MSFWQTSDNDDATKTDGSFESGGGNFDPIPEGSSVLAMPDEAKWDSPRDRSEEFVSIRWSVIAPQEYANRKVYQKLWVDDHDPSVRDSTKAVRKTDKAKRMLAAIDANAGGKLARNAKRPDDADLATALLLKQMVIKLGVWSMTNERGEENSGNWVMAVSRKANGTVEAKPAAAVQTSQGQTRVTSDDDDFDSVPF
jgi:hypothetical protein